MRKVILSLFILACSGCTAPTESNYIHNINTWIGHTPEELVSQWGQPTQVIPHQDTLYYIYTTDKIMNLTNMVATGGINDENALYPLESPKFNQTNLFCETTFIVQDDIITNWSFEGNSCVAH